MYLSFRALADVCLTSAYQEWFRIKTQPKNFDQIFRHLQYLVFFC